jgi:DNA helicase HerA-like ATPase
MATQENEYIGTLVGNTGDPRNLRVALRSKSAGRRGEFVRLRHQEREDEPPADVLGRLISISRSNVLYNEALGEGVSEIEMVVSRVSGETVFASLELVGYKDPMTHEIKIPRAALDPGTKVYRVDYSFLSQFYEFAADTSVHLGNLVGYERGDNVVPIYLDANLIATEHLAVLAMTGAGKSYTVGRIIERLVTKMNASVIVFDPHGEYGRAFQHGQLHFHETDPNYGDLDDVTALARIRDTMTTLQAQGAGMKVYTPRDPSFAQKYAGAQVPLALMLDHMDLDDLKQIMPELTSAQERVLDVALRYWTRETPEPRDIGTLLNLLTKDLERLRNYNLTAEESKSLRGGSAAIVAITLRRLVNSAKAFYQAGAGDPLDVYQMVGRRNPIEQSDRLGRLAIVDLQGQSQNARQVTVALICNEVIKAAMDEANPIRPVFLVFEEGHNFAPARQGAISKNIIKRIASEGRKFGVGFAIVSQRPSRLDPDVTSQCNTIVAMRIKNPDDQRFISSTSDYFSRADIDELPSLSTGEALIVGRAILAPLIVKVGPKALIHGGESPNVCDVWRRQ